MKKRPHEFRFAEIKNEITRAILPRGRRSHRCWCAKAPGTRHNSFGPAAARRIGLRNACNGRPHVPLRRKSAAAGNARAFQPLFRENFTGGNPAPTAQTALKSAPTLPRREKKMSSQAAARRFDIRRS